MVRSGQNGGLHRHGVWKPLVGKSKIAPNALGTTSKEGSVKLSYRDALLSNIKTGIRGPEELDHSILNIKADNNVNNLATISIPVEDNDWMKRFMTGVMKCSFELDFVQQALIHDDDPIEKDNLVGANGSAEQNLPQEFLGRVLDGCRLSNPICFQNALVPTLETLNVSTISPTLLNHGNNLANNEEGINESGHVGNHGLGQSTTNLEVEKEISLGGRSIDVHGHAVSICSDSMSVYNNPTVMGLKLNGPENICFLIIKQFVANGSGHDVNFGGANSLLVVSSHNLSNHRNSECSVMMVLDSFECCDNLNEENWKDDSVALLHPQSGLFTYAPSNGLFRASFQRRVRRQIRDSLDGISSQPGKSTHLSSSKDHISDDKLEVEAVWDKNPNIRIGGLIKMSRG
ncbi:hypothetical protein V6N13_059554 [Hibiscus sabdariffa]